MKKRKICTLLFASITLVFLGCEAKNTENQEVEDLSKEQVVPNKVIENLTLTTGIENKLFSIPSPIQTAMLVKEVNTLFNPELLNPLLSIDNYITENKKALNLGVYGTNISYLALYNESKILIDYISSVETIADDLGISNSFSVDLLDRFQRNLSNEDSILVVLSQAYRQGDGFLKDNQRKDISMLILTGGFVETMYLATKLYEETNSDLFIQRIGEQKETVKTIIEVMEIYNTDNGYHKLITSLSELLAIYDKLTLEYVYIPSETDVKNKTTIIKSKSVLTMDKSVKEKLIKQIQQLRNEIIA